MGAMNHPVVKPRQSEALPYEYNSKLLENIGINTTFEKKDGARNYLKPLS